MQFKAATISTSILVLLLLLFAPRDETATKPFQTGGEPHQSPGSDDAIDANNPPVGRETTRIKFSDREDEDKEGYKFRQDLTLTAADKLSIRLHTAAAEESPETYFRFVADGGHPLPPWKAIATPIVCDGKEYYSGHFSIPPQNILAAPKRKSQDWATVVPGRKETYKFKIETQYRRDLEESRFAITRRRYGYATNRNLEILAAGSIPFFCGIQTLPKTGTLQSLPLHFLSMVTQYPDVRVRCWPNKLCAGYPIPTKTFNETRYDLVAAKLLDYTRLYQSSTHLAKYVLSATSLQRLPRNVLVLWASHYSIFLTSLLNGLRNLDITVEDVPRRNTMYADAACESAKATTYAKGWFFFCKTKESTGVPRENIEARIRAREFDLIIISVTDTLTYYMKDPRKEIPFFGAIVDSYPRDLVLTINDADLIRNMQADIAHKLMHNMSLYFKRETHGCSEYIDYRRDRPAGGATVRKGPAAGKGIR